MRHREMRLIGLDSSEPDLDSGRIGREAHRWLAERFAESPEQLKVVAMHHHLVPVPGTGRERNIVHDAGDLLRVLADAGVDLVLCGHKHVPNVWRLEDMLIINAGHVLHAPSPRPRAAELQHHRDRRGRRSRPRVAQGAVRRRRDRCRLLRRAPERMWLARRRHRGERAGAVSRVVALIDGEHYPPVVRFALEQLAREHEVVAAAFLGGTEKIDADEGLASYGVPLVTGPTPADTLATALAEWAPEVVIDLSDEPVLTSAGRMALASVALGHGVAYRGADFAFEPQRELATPLTPVLALIGTGKRVGKTAVAADIARRLAAAGRDVVVLAMGRGGPAEPELIRGDEVALATADLLALARLGKHASSDNYEDAVMSRVTTVGAAGAAVGWRARPSSATSPRARRSPTRSARSCSSRRAREQRSRRSRSTRRYWSWARAGATAYVRDYFGPYRVAQADLVVIAGAEEPVASAEEVARIRAIVARAAPGPARDRDHLPAAPDRARRWQARVLRHNRAARARVPSSPRTSRPSTAATSSARARTSRTACGCAPTWRRAGRLRRAAHGAQGRRDRRRRHGGRGGWGADRAVRQRARLRWTARDLGAQVARVAQLAIDRGACARDGASQ